MKFQFTKSRIILSSLFLLVSLNFIVLFSFFILEQPSLHISDMYIDPEQHIKSGDILVFDVSRCATKDLNYKFSVEILGVDNDKIYILESGESFIEQGCEVVNSIPKQLPKIKPGQYVLKSKVQYEGKFKNFEQLVLSNVFEIK